MIGMKQMEFGTKSYPSALNTALAHAHVHQITSQKASCEEIPARQGHQAAFDDIYRSDLDYEARLLQTSDAKTGSELAWLLNESI